MEAATKGMFTQMSTYKGFKIFGERAVTAMLKQFKQFDEGAIQSKPVFGPIDPNILTDKQKEQALGAVSLIKEKRCSKIKGHTCTNGSEQYKYLKVDETVVSPTCSLEFLMLSLLIDVYEGRDTVVFDVPGAFLQSDIPKDKLLLLISREQFVNITCEVDKEHKKYVQYDEKVRKVLYVRYLQAIYRYIKAVILWCNLYL